MFLGQKGNPATLIEDALKRAKAYADAGASGLFIPGLTDPVLIKQIVLGTDLPVNVMIMNGLPSNEQLRETGVARISYESIPFFNAVTSVKTEAEKVFLT